MVPFSRLTPTLSCLMVVLALPVLIQTVGVHAQAPTGNIEGTVADRFGRILQAGSPRLTQIAAKVIF